MPEVIGDRRQFFRQGLNALYLPFYDGLCQALPPCWRPYSGVRSPEKQNETFAIGRVQLADGSWKVVDPGKIETDARDWESPHPWGCATDWTWFDEDGVLHWLERSDPRWQEYGAAVQQVKLRWGEEFHDIDHNELKIAVSWKDIKQVLESQGKDAANAAIQKAILTG